MVVYGTVLDSPLDGGDYGNDAGNSNCLAGFVNSFQAVFGGGNTSGGEVKYSLKQDRSSLIKKSNLSIKNGYGKTGASLFMGSHYNDSVVYEDIYHIDNSIIDDMNWYAKGSGQAVNPSSAVGPDSTHWVSVTSAVHSLFNPYYGLQAGGIYPGLPLTSKLANSRTAQVQDCSIRNLVNLSKQGSNQYLGLCRYKYADFMYCKDLGMPNNHLITLRRFAAPIGDNIYGSSSTTAGSGPEYLGDVGHLVGYFGTEDNKLEDIINYSMHGTWKEMNAEIQQLPSQEDNRTSPLGMVINTLNPQYNSMVESSRAGANNLYQKLGGGSWYQGHEIFTNYDKHKIYEPKNTVQSMHMYEGKLEFSHEFTLVFSYKIRGYGDINGKAAMLDLIGNVAHTTYSRGSFWGGRREIIGPQPNKSGWQKANQFIDKAWDGAGDMLQSFVDNGFDLGGLLGQVSSALGNAYNQVADAAQKVASNPQGAVKSLVDGAGKLGIGKALKGKLKDALGRPALYAFNSLLTGDDTGLWHVTIGNPLNPIVSMGNLILTDCKVQHFGPLGIDDFPTELKVTVTLKHARGRDAVSVQKMYTRGGDSIYIPYVSENPSEIFPSPSSVGDYIGDTNNERIRGNMYQVI